MDLNELLHAHQLATMQAQRLQDPVERQNQFDLIALFAGRVRRLREEGGVSANPVAFLVGEPKQAPLTD